MHSVRYRLPYRAIAVNKHGTANLRAVVLEAEIPMARRRLPEIRNFAFDLDEGIGLLKKCSSLGGYFADAPDWLVVI